MLGLESLEGTVIEHRIDEVMKWSASRNQSYRPRQGGVNKNLKNFLPEQLEYMQDLNEELFHTFGYVKHENNDTETQFVDYNGKAKASSVDKINYYRKLNEKAFEKRLKTRHGELPKTKTVVHKD